MLSLISFSLDLDTTHVIIHTLPIVSLNGARDRTINQWAGPGLVHSYESVLALLLGKLALLALSARMQMLLTCMFELYNMHEAVFQPSITK